MVRFIVPLGGGGPGFRFSVERSVGRSLRALHNASDAQEVQDSSLLRGLLRLPVEVHLQGMPRCRRELLQGDVSAGSGLLAYRDAPG